MKKQKFLHVDAEVPRPLITTVSERAEKAVADFAAKNPEFSDVRVSSIAMNKHTLVILVSYKEAQAPKQRA